MLSPSLQETVMEEESIELSTEEAKYYMEGSESTPQSINLLNGVIGTTFSPNQQESVTSNASIEFSTNKIHQDIEGVGLTLKSTILKNSVEQTTFSPGLNEIVTKDEYEQFPMEEIHQDTEGSGSSSQNIDRKVSHEYFGHSESFASRPDASAEFESEIDSLNNLIKDNRPIPAYDFSGKTLSAYHLLHPEDSKLEGDDEAASKEEKYENVSDEITTENEGYFHHYVAYVSNQTKNSVKRSISP